MRTLETIHLRRKRMRLVFAGTRELVGSPERQACNHIHALNSNALGRGLLSEATMLEACRALSIYRSKDVAGSGFDVVLLGQSLRVPLDEATQHFIEFRRMLSVREVAGAIENIHSGIVRIPRNEIE